jgi:hypothetical protein
VIVHLARMAERVQYLDVVTRVPVEVDSLGISVQYEFESKFNLHLNSKTTLIFIKSQHEIKLKHNIDLN